MRGWTTWTFNQWTMFLSMYLTPSLYFKWEDGPHEPSSSGRCFSACTWPHPSTLNERMDHMNLQSVDDVSQHVLVYLFILLAQCFLSKHDIHPLFINVGPASYMVDQHWTSNGPISRACWEDTNNKADRINKAQFYSLISTVETPFNWLLIFENLTLWSCGLVFHVPFQLPGKHTDLSVRLTLERIVLIYTLERS